MSKSDRELLVLAAKAMGKDLRFFPYGVIDWCWNPLRDDGDALRLAVKLGITIGIEYGRKYAHASGLVEKPIDGDLYSATRRAIVRAAAAIGAQMP